MCAVNWLFYDKKLLIAFNAELKLPRNIVGRAVSLMFCVICLKLFQMFSIKLK